MENPAESIRLFALCGALKWAHLPVAGGIYDQHPKLIDQWMVLFRATQDHQQQEMDRQKAESKRRR